MTTSLVGAALLVHLDSGPGFVRFYCFLLDSSEKQDNLEQEKKKKNKAKEKTVETEDVSKEEEDKEKDKETNADTDPIDDDISLSDSQVIAQFILSMEIK
jgi:hypothetical protein